MPKTCRSVVAGALAAWCLLGAGHDAARADNTLPVKAMTFNIRCNTAIDGPNRWPHRREMAADVIRRAEPDFAGLQEAEPDQIADLLKLLPEYHMLGRSREKNPKVGEASPIFYRHKRWRLDAKQNGTFWLSDTPEKPGSITWGNACTRIVTWGRFTEAKIGRGLYVYNTHLDHISEPSRQKSAVLMAQRITGRKSPEPVLVTGDFNSGESSAAIAWLTGKKPGSPLALIDTFRVLHPDEKQVGTFHGFRGGTKGEKIDYILVPPGTRVLSAEILHDTRNGRFPSDHYPVAAEIIFPK
jgi:endonuclease/exonuclease/phosphatase family metal-dependent hydrolase